LPYVAYLVNIYTSGSTSGFLKLYNKQVSKSELHRAKQMFTVMFASFSSVSRRRQLAMLTIHGADDFVPQQIC